MGGFFSPQQVNPVTVDPFTAEDRRFGGRIRQGIEQIGEQPIGAISPLEADTLWSLMGLGGGALGQLGGMISGDLGPVGAATRAGILGAGVQGLGPIGATLRGEFLNQQNPYVQALRSQVLDELGEAKRRFAGAAQRAGALSSTDYLRGIADLESKAAAQLGGLAFDQFERERQRQLGAVSSLSALANTLTGAAMLPQEQAMRGIAALPGLGSWLLGAAGLPRELAVQATLLPINLGLQYMNAARGVPVMPQYAPSPFAQLLGGVAGLIGPLARLGVIRF